MFAALVGSSLAEDRTGWAIRKIARTAAAAHVAARSCASAPKAQPPIDSRRPWFMLKPAGLFDRNPAPDVPAPGGAARQRHECMQRRVDPGKERE